MQDLAALSALPVTAAAAAPWGPTLQGGLIILGVVSFLGVTAFGHVADVPGIGPRVALGGDRAPAASDGWLDVRVCLAWLALSVSTLQTYFYMSTFEDQARLFLPRGAVRLQLELFAVLYPVLSFAFSFVHSELLASSATAVWRGWALLAVAAPAWGVLSTRQGELSQVVAMVFFLFWRIGVFVVFYEECLERAHAAGSDFGTLSLGGLTLAGAATFLSVPLTWWASSPPEAGRGFVVADLFLTLLSSCTAMAAACMAYSKGPSGCSALGPSARAPGLRLECSTQGA
mmetsp:Transcript_96780/g.289057  ORF Transcript_96780/g.289057 Transcript_96780/m.289057 type:complete len:287 (+) Transcript_96780:2-862(+)